MITIVPYNPNWPCEFEQLASLLRNHLGGDALRIDHIGSTAVPGLAAKDKIDVQITVRGLRREMADALTNLDFVHVERITSDHVPPGASDDPSEWAKWFFRQRDPRRAVNVHVRIHGRANQRYPLLFRDYLRAHPIAAEAYGRHKVALATHHPDDIDAYCEIKDPVCDLIMVAAEEWAQKTGWRPT